MANPTAKPQSPAHPANGASPAISRAEEVKAQRAKLKASAYVLRAESMIVAMERDKFPPDGAPFKAALVLAQALREASK